jgi:hypothetical protein
MQVADLIIFIVGTAKTVVLCFTSVEGCFCSTSDHSLGHLLHLHIIVSHRPYQSILAQHHSWLD